MQYKFQELETTKMETPSYCGNENAFPSALLNSWSFIPFIYFLIFFLVLDCKLNYYLQLYVGMIG